MSRTVGNMNPALNCGCLDAALASAAGATARNYGLEYAAALGDGTNVVA
jgi:hypothetical protein